MSDATEVDTILATYSKRLAEMAIVEFRSLLAAERVKDRYSTEELIAALGKARWTIQEKWCIAGRIERERPRL